MMETTYLPVQDITQTDEPHTDSPHPTADQYDQVYCVTWGFWFYLVVGVMCLLGLAGNTLSILVLRKDNSHRVAALLLEALAAADNLVLITSLVVLVLWFGMAPYLWPDSQLQVSLYYQTIISN